VICKHCSSGKIIKKGIIKTKMKSMQQYKCKECGKRFTLNNLKCKTYPANIIMDAVSYYNLGYGAEESSRLIGRKYKIKVPAKTIYPWIKEFNEICSYHRIRDKAKALYKPKEIILNKVFMHQQLYEFKYHHAKGELFINEYFSGLRDYLMGIAGDCPHRLFENSNRSSAMKLDFDVSNIKIAKKENYACRLAGLGLEVAQNNRQRHMAVQDFMLVNDTCTIAAEVPIYLLNDEIKHYKFINPDDNKESITGHIDLVQMKFGQIYVLDFKPEADKENISKVVSQLFVYALALSVRTDVWLRNFRCAWFDSSGYYEFSPSEIVLMADEDMPFWKRKQFVFDEKARRYMTSRFWKKKEKII